MQKPKAKYKVGQAFMHLEKKKIFEIHQVDHINNFVAPRPPTQGDQILYTVTYLPKPTGDDKVKHGRYYESVLKEKCVRISTANTEMAQILYGIKL